MSSLQQAYDYLGPPVAGAAIGTVLAGPLGAAAGAEAGSIRALLMDLAAGQVGGAIARHFAVRNPPANNNEDPNVSPDAWRVSDGSGGGRGMPPGWAGPPGGSGGGDDNGWNQLTNEEQQAVWMANHPNQMHESGIKNWVEAGRPMGVGAPDSADQLHLDLMEANEVMGILKPGGKRVFLWGNSIEDSRIPVYSQESLDKLNEGMRSGQEPIGSFRATIDDDGIIRTDTSVVLPFGNPLIVWFSPFVGVGDYTHD